METQRSPEPPKKFRAVDFQSMNRSFREPETSPNTVLNTSQKELSPESMSRAECAIFGSSADTPRSLNKTQITEASEKVSVSRECCLDSDCENDNARRRCFVGLKNNNPVSFVENPEIDGRLVFRDSSEAPRWVIVSCPLKVCPRLKGEEAMEGVAEDNLASLDSNFNMPFKQDAVTSGAITRGKSNVIQVVSEEFPNPSSESIGSKFVLEVNQAGQKKREPLNLNLCGKLSVTREPDSFSKWQTSLSSIDSLSALDESRTANHEEDSVLDNAAFSVVTQQGEVKSEDVEMENDDDLRKVNRNEQSKEPQNLPKCPPTSADKRLLQLLNIRHSSRETLKPHNPTLMEPFLNDNTRNSSITLPKHTTISHPVTSTSSSQNSTVQNVSKTGSQKSRIQNGTGKSENNHSCTTVEKTFKAPWSVSSLPAHPLFGLRKPGQENITDSNMDCSDDSVSDAPSSNKANSTPSIFPAKPHTSAASNEMVRATHTQPISHSLSIFHSDVSHCPQQQKLLQQQQQQLSSANRKSHPQNGVSSTSSSTNSISSSPTFSSSSPAATPSSPAAPGCTSEALDFHPSNSTSELSPPTSSAASISPKPSAVETIGMDTGRRLRVRNQRKFVPEKTRHKRQTLQDMTRPLKQWLYEHRENPYPSKSDKMDLVKTSDMTLMQVSNWFANARRRLKNTVKGDDVSWAKRIKVYNKYAEGNAELFSIPSSDEGGWDSDEELADEDRDQRPESVPIRCESSTPSPAPTLTSSLSDTALTSPTTAQSSMTSPNGTTRSSPALEDGQGSYHKYKHSILQRYLQDASHQALVHDDDVMASRSRHRHLSSSTGSHDFEYLSTSSVSSSSHEAHHDAFDDFSEEFETIAIRRRMSENSPVNDSDEMYWKEISAALALTSLARSYVTK